MADVVIPNITIYFYADEVKDIADYTEDQTDDSTKYIQDLPVGVYWFKVEGSYNGTPIAEEYKKFIVNEDSIEDWEGVIHDKINEPQSFRFSCDLAIALFTINVSYEGSVYTNATVEVGENDDTHYPREATDGTGGVYTIDNIKTNSTIPVKVIPDSGDTNIKEEIVNVSIGNGNKTVDIELFYYFNLAVISYKKVSNSKSTDASQPDDPVQQPSRIYPGSANLYDTDGNLITTLSNVEGALLTSDKIKKGTYKLEIPSFLSSDRRTFKKYEREITVEKDTNNTDGLREITAYIEEVVVIDEPDDPAR